MTPEPAMLRRLVKAHRMIRDLGASVDEAARACGWSAGWAMRPTFKRCYGYSPVKAKTLKQAEMVSASLAAGRTLTQAAKDAGMETGEAAKRARLAGWIHEGPARSGRWVRNEGE